MDKNVSAWFKNRELFEKMLREGHRWEMHVADVLEGLGYDVDRPPPIVTVGDVNNRADYVDQKDITANGVVLEVKSRNLEFTCPTDFPYETVFVDTKSGFQAKNVKPRIYVCVSQKTKGIIALDVEKTFDDWGVARTWDSVRRINLTAYDCHRTKWEGLEEVCQRVIGEMRRQ